MLPGRNAEERLAEAAALMRTRSGGNLGGPSARWPADLVDPGNHASSRARDSIFSCLFPGCGKKLTSYAGIRAHGLGTHNKNKWWDQREWDRKVSEQRHCTAEELGRVSGSRKDGRGWQGSLAPKAERPKTRAMEIDPSSAAANPKKGKRAKAATAAASAAPATASSSAAPAAASASSSAAASTSAVPAAASSSAAPAAAAPPTANMATEKTCAACDGVMLGSTLHACGECGKPVHGWVLCESVMMPVYDHYFCSTTCLQARNAKADASAADEDARPFPVRRRPESPVLVAGQGAVRDLRQQQQQQNKGSKRPMSELNADAQLAQKLQRVQKLSPTMKLAKMTPQQLQERKKLVISQLDLLFSKHANEEVPDSVLQVQLGEIRSCSEWESRPEVLVAVLKALENDNVLMWRDNAIHKI